MTSINMTTPRKTLFLLLFITLILASCASLPPYTAPEKEKTATDSGATSRKTGLEQDKVTAASPSENRAASATAPADAEAQLKKNQEQLDSALEYVQASNEFWEQGDLDNALDALDKAYSLLLRVKEGDNSEIAQQKEDLRFTISKRILAVYTSRFTVANGSRKAIPLEKNEHVQKALDLFTGSERSFFLNAYRRSGRYRPAIVNALKEAGLPEELSWLPLIESGYNVRALSSARALGLWQFIASTGYRYGLQRDQWIDERMNLEKSTKAAIAYLKDLHQIFGDWTTVLAAYNCGEWGVLNRIKTQKINYLDNFWDLYLKLPNETAFYVPKFLAVLHIISDPRAYGMTLPPVEKNDVEVEEVTINKEVHLETIAKRLNMDFELLKDLNPELRQYLTPNSPYQLIVPAGKGETLLAEMGDIPVYRPVYQPPAPSAPSYVMHRVRSGDTLSKIAVRYKADPNAIMAVNGLKKNHHLQVGGTLKIPAKGAPVPAAEKRVAYVSQPKQKLIEYAVKKGDNLWSIANQFHTTTKAIQSMNRIKTVDLHIGQVLLIPPTGGAPAEPAYQTYRVKKGDTPALIAKSHGMDLVEFLKLNKMTPRSTIFPGQLVRIRSN